MGVRVTVGLVLVMTMLLVAGPVLAQGKWSQLKPIPQGEEEVYGTAAGGKMYVLGGNGVSSSRSRRAKRKSTARPPAARCTCSAVSARSRAGNRR